MLRHLEFTMFELLKAINQILFYKMRESITFKMRLLQCILIETIMEGIYKINLVPPDLSTEETILQIADTLDNLNGVVDDVFARLMGRIKQNIDKTNKLTERIEISRKKVETLTGMQKAIKVFSSAKYPASIVHEHYKSIFDLDVYQHKPQKVTLSGKTQGQSNDKGIQVIW